MFFAYFQTLLPVNMILQNKYMQKLHTEHEQEAAIEHFRIYFGLRTTIKYWTWEVYMR